MFRGRDSGGKLKELYEAVSKGGTLEIFACACPQRESSLAWKDPKLHQLEETRPSGNRPEGDGGDVTHRDRRRNSVDAAGAFLGLGQSTGSNDEEHLEHIWTLTPTQRKIEAVKTRFAYKTGKC